MQVDADRTSVAPNMAEDAPLPLTLVEGLEPSSDLIDGVHVGDVGCPSKAQERPQEKGTSQRRDAHELNEPYQGIGVGQGRNNSEGETKEEADETTRLDAGDQANAGALGLGHDDG